MTQFFIMEFKPSRFLLIADLFINSEACVNIYLSVYLFNSHNIYFRDFEPMLLRIILTP